MKTKEAIEKLNHGSKAFLTDSILDMNILELISLLKRGEKFEAMWERCKKHHSYDGYVGKIMNDFEQKYFPKE